MSNEPKAFMSVKELADYLDVSIKVIYGLRYRGEGPPAVRIGRELRFATAAIDAWIASRTESLDGGDE